jgi:hypothetical protein
MLRWTKKLVKDKRSSLFCSNVSEEENSFTTLTPGAAEAEAVSRSAK